MIVSKQLVKNY